MSIASRIAVTDIPKFAAATVGMAQLVYQAVRAYHKPNEPAPSNPPVAE